MITLRKARLVDGDTVVKLWKEFMAEHDKNVIRKNHSLRPYTKKRRNAASQFGKFVRKNIRSRNSIILFAEVNNEPVGYVMSFIKKNVPIFKLDKIGYISDLYVRKGYRKMGISKMFKNWSIKWFKNKGIKHVSIMVNSENRRAHNIYRKWGFNDYVIELRRKV